MAEGVIKLIASCRYTLAECAQVESRRQPFLKTIIVFSIRRLYHYYHESVELVLMPNEYSLIHDSDETCRYTLTGPALAL